MGNADLLTHLRDYLASKGLGRDPRTAGSEYPIWREPRDGAVAPSEKEGDEDNADLVLSLYRTGGVPRGYFEDAVFLTPSVDVFLRGRTAALVFAYEAGLTPSLVREDAAFVPRTNWDMAGLSVIESSLWRPLQPVDRGEQGYTFVVSYLFELYQD